jgi:hypothetical protein
LPLCLKMSKRQKYLQTQVRSQVNSRYPSKILLLDLYFPRPLRNPAELRKFGCGHGYNHRWSMCIY